jgi:peroxiredoxin
MTTSIELNRPPVVGIRPGLPAPELVLNLVGGGTWSLAKTAPAGYLLLIVYRGSFCPHCKRQMTDLVSLAGELEKRGVQVMLASADDEARARQAKDEWGMADVDVGYGLSVEDMRRWGLYVTQGFPGGQPLIAEPGVFLIKPDHTVFYAAISSAPFGRPPLREVLAAIDRTIERPGAKWGDQ